MRTIRGCGIVKDQILRSGTSIGANIREAQYGYSEDDFVFKLQTLMQGENKMEKETLRKLLSSELKKGDGLAATTFLFHADT